MLETSPVLHLLCGKIASGKSTLSAQLAKEPGTVILSEDEWLHRLFGEQMQTGADFIQFSQRLRFAMAPHVRSLLAAGLSVVLDFAANTVEQRRWMSDIAHGGPWTHKLHFLDVSDDLCLKRLRERNASGTHAFAATEEQFLRFTAHFVPPTEAEGFNIVRY